MKIFNGKKEAEKILLDLKNKISPAPFKYSMPTASRKIALEKCGVKKNKKKLRLAIVMVGKNPASELYVKLKKEAAEKIGLEVIEERFQKNAKELKIIQRIKDFNQDKSVDGIIVQLPLPTGLKTEKIIQSISPKKDIDGFHKLNRKLLKKGTPYFFPVLPSAILTALKKSGKNFKNKKILALVNSNVFGRVLKDFFKINSLKIEYNLFDKKDIKDIVKKADVLITVLNKPNFIKGSMIKKEVVLIDAGFIKKDKKAIGNIDKESVGEKAGWLSPVPGGVGPLTVALLLKNVFLASQRS
ncbi:MAG: hypothetical protein A3A94_02085 [Candidatus Portnoybacteria bacterium RIFCSPLOWO2_01_FULL_43_11]|uniref:Bifunctional protein FolD n=4 Tax=Candidatus Portnoyibacteriota TaxID=1817913 RepID=A0A1G2FD68_9BACT|nr:MAG: hypothetical protein A2815_01890 [Candidatus Portnoybacteria bacterium RIFCSPHIGHO2_01_FULL_40_12b]OGZ37158.1 MAG: hypothetical protein A3D38_01305 [Candidatus Portnoybacteria bacterium RIFCSPHIGHO2_02_FULL_40_23]OGZ37694.1 MAG: hypothetical protein A3E90_00180 [Candidatus Portnoybacteria bacterium RIFCSPHIGHO2_12_FULL_40_11]OGZ38804.1 MAG: hypothetical protein A3A94_02085 [Candidatus Portnoybacteria bacterium RIFCSPLOWO2_01_FULL_43_11]OGZ40393.1 MAG: hypothetical protein A3I20_01790 [C